MKTIFLSLFFLFISNSYAKEFNVFDYKIDKNNISILEKNLPHPNILRGNFKQIKTLKEIDKKFISTGSFIFSKEDGVVWKIQKPFISNLVFTKDKLMTIDNQGKKTIIENNKSVFSEISNIFQSLFVGDYSKMAEYFQIFFFQNQNGWIIGLEPNSEVIRDAIKRIIIKGKDNVQEILLEEEFDDKILIKFTNVSSKPNQLTKNEKDYFSF